MLPAEIEEQSETGKLLESIRFPVLFVLFLWVVYLESFVRGIDLSWLGIMPRAWKGLPGILSAPVIHGSLRHLFSNSIPLLVLSSGILYFYRQIAWKVLSIIYLGEGILVWFFARHAWHIGASGLVYGFAAFLFISGLIRRHNGLLAISMIVTLFYGSMIWGILPIQKGVSWESHLGGALMGLITAVIFRNRGKENDPGEFEETSETEDNTSSTIGHYIEVPRPEDD